MPRASTGNDTKATSSSPARICWTSASLVPEVRDFSARMSSTNFPEQPGQHVGGDHCRGTADSQTSAFGAGKLRHFLHRCIVIAQNLSRALQQLLARFGEHHATRRANKKSGAEFIFQLSYLHARSE